jgi:transposase
MDQALDALPDDVATLRAELALARSERQATEDALRLASASHSTLSAEHAVAKAKAAEDMAIIAHQRLVIEKLQRQIHGQRSERSARLTDQLEITFEELEATATEAELLAEMAVAKATHMAGFTRSRPQTRLNFPDHLPRERVVVHGPIGCSHVQFDCYCQDEQDRSASLACRCPRTYCSSYRSPS